MLQMALQLQLTDFDWIAPAADNGVWYPNRFGDERASNEPFLSRSIAKCHAAVTEAGADGRRSPSGIALIGFSQGGCLALEYVLRHPGWCTSIVVFTGALIGPPGTTWKPTAGTLAGTRILLTGSDSDQWLPADRSSETARVLADLGADVRLHIYQGRPHIISHEEISEARQFLLDMPRV
jgi:predicted esterase